MVSFYSEELGFAESSSSVLHYGNKAIQLTSDFVLHERTKHVEVDVHFLCEKVCTRVITP